MGGQNNQTYRQSGTRTSQMRPSSLLGSEINQSRVHMPLQRQRPRRNTRALTIPLIGNFTTHDLLHLVQMLHEVEAHRELSPCETNILNEFDQLLIKALQTHLNKPETN